MFVDRREAGRRLAALLAPFTAERPVVLGIARQGLSVAEEVATALGAPLDVLVVRRVIVPEEAPGGQRGVAVGAVAEGGVRLIDEARVAATEVDDTELAALEHVEALEAERVARLYRGDHPRISLRGRTVIVVDDGIASGSTMRAACCAVRELGAARVVAAVPVAPEGWRRAVGDDLDDLVAVDLAPEPVVLSRHYAAAPAAGA